MIKIYDYFKKNNILANIILTILATFSTELLISFSENIICPFIDTNNDAISDCNNMRYWEIITRNGVKINIGKFLVSFIKFSIAIILMILFILFLK